MTRVRAWGSFVASMVATVAVLALVALGACGEATEEPQESRTILQAPIGSLVASVDATRWHTHVPFGAGQGRGGFLDAAHDIYHLRASFDLMRAAGARVEVPWERWSSEALFFEMHGDTATDEGARDRWVAAWQGVAAEPCVVEPGRRLGLRVTAPGVAPAGWRVIVLEAESWASTARALAPDCASLVRELAR